MENPSGRELSHLVVEDLRNIAIEINKTVESTINTVAASKIKVGENLLEARALIGNDQAFGEWRISETVVKSKQHAHYLMQVAKKFSDAPKLIATVNYSTLQELVLADQVAIKWVQDRVDEGKAPTIKETRAKVKETQAERLAPREQKGTSKKAGINKTGKVAPNININATILMSLTHRFEAAAETEDTLLAAYLILGMDPDPQSPMHRHNLRAIRDTWYESTDIDSYKDAINGAYDIVEKEFKEW
jgi:hypothetical protein